MIPSLEPHDIRFFPTPEALRDWFDANHASATELWLGYHRKSSGTPSVDWPQAVDEALCFGCLDGNANSSDEKTIEIERLRKEMEQRDTLIAALQTESHEHQRKLGKCYR